MNILVTGSHGQLGTHLQLSSARFSEAFFFTDIDTLDITNDIDVQSFLSHHNIDVVINCAAYTNVDKAEEEESQADKVNHQAVKILAEACHTHNATLVHISTDYVFGGNKNNTPCTETQPTNPTGAYGRTKLLGENAIINSGCRYLIIRTSWLYSEFGKNFVRTMLNVTGSKKTCKVVYDQIGTPTYAGDLAQAILHIVSAGIDECSQGIYNYSNEGVCSWFDFTHEIARQAGHTECDIQPCLSSEYPSTVIRPAYSVLDKSKIKQTFGLKIPYWTLSLAQCIQNLQKQA